MTIWRRLTIGAAGLLAGLIAALGLTLIQLLMREWFGIWPPQEMIPDRFAPTVDVDRFIELVNEYGYNELKRFGVRAGLAGVLAVGTLVGVAYALTGERAMARGGRSWAGVSLAGLAFVAAAFVVLFVGSLAVLWPNLDTNARGLPPDQARRATIAGYFAAYLFYAAILVATYRLITRPVSALSPASTDEHADDPALGTRHSALGTSVLPRRAVVAAVAGAALAYPSVRLLRNLENEATFSYDGRRYSGPGILPITPNNRFYTVTKNVVDPDVDRDIWRLEVSGHVERSTTYDFEDLQGFASVDQLTTLMCISNHVSHGLISNAEWRGVRLADVLEAAGVKDGAVEVLLHAADGYTDTFAIAKALEPETLLAFEMNGEPLPRIHGYPVRVIVPGLYGEKNVKWVTGIEVVTHDAEGFYEQQGWGPDFTIPTRSDFFSPQLAGGNSRFRDEFAVNRPVELKGRAFGGNRGISKVEISFDDGETWAEVAGRAYEGSDLEWSFWRHTWNPTQPGEYLLVVRAYDGSGALQELTRRDSHPREGVTGLHRVRATVV
jgi:DMSO/TMAO reductase YedYZ molybdopterin-dependent catalytic subunit